VPLSSFAAASLSPCPLMFVAVLLASGSLALERTENAFARPRPRAPCRAPACSSEKVSARGPSALVVTL
jgi:hypothetical protein